VNPRAIWALAPLIITLVLTAGASALQAQERPVVRFGVVIDGPFQRNDEVRGMFQTEIIDLIRDDFDPQFPDEKRITCDWTLESVRAAVDQLLADDDVDFVLALGVIASNEIAKKRELPKPVIAPIVIDAGLQQLPGTGGTSGVKNLNYLSFPKNIAADIKAFLEIVEFEKLAILMSKPVLDAIPDAPVLFHEFLSEFNVESVTLAVDQSVEDAINRLPDDIEAVYTAPLIHLPQSEFKALTDSLISRKLPSFSMFGREDVELGILASVNTNIFPRLTRRVGINVQRILLGEEAGSLPTRFAAEHRMTINMETGRAIDVYPSWGILTEAEILNARVRDINRVISLDDAAADAVRVNLTLRARTRDVEAAAQEIAIARADLLPNLNAGLLARQIDRETADQSAGQAAERVFSGNITLQQVLYADPVWANFQIQKHLQDSREYDRDVLMLDIAKDGATSYLNVLRANTFESIQQENLRQTRSNLELARVREAIGVARPAEVLRWESQIAGNRQAVIESSAQRNLAEIDLNRLLDRPIEEEFRTEDIDLNDPNLLLSQGRLIERMSNPWDFRILRAFMVQEGLTHTPEIKALNAAIDAQERAVTATSREFWLPKFVLSAEVVNVFERTGAGSTIPPPLQPVFDTPEDLTWNVAISMEYPLFPGGRRLSERRLATGTLEALRIELGSVEQIVEQRIRSAFHIMGAAYANIEQSRLASLAANETLELVEESYSLGAVTILDLLDSQNTALVANLAAANAIYDFLIELMEAERSVGKLVLQMSEAERDSFFQRMDTYFSENSNGN